MSSRDGSGLENLLTAIAIDGKWLRGIGDGQQVKLFAAMLHQEKAVIAQHRIPEDTNEITQVRQLPDPVDLENAVVTGDAAHAQRDTAAYIAGPEEQGGRGSDYFLFAKGNQPRLQRGIYDAIEHQCPGEPDHAGLDYSHGRIIKRAIWVTDAGELDFPHASQVMRIHRDGYDATGTLVSKEIVHAVTSLAAQRAAPADLAKIARGHWGIESVHSLRGTAYREDSDTGYTRNGPQVIATYRSIAIRMLHLASVTEITPTLQPIGRDRTRMLSYLPL